MKGPLAKLRYPLFSTVGLAAVLSTCSHLAPVPNAPSTTAREPSSGNRATTLVDGLYVNETEEPILPLFASATKSLDVEIYEMGDKDLRAILRQAIAKNVRIRVVKEPEPYEVPGTAETCKYFEPATENDSDDCQDQKALVDEIQSSPGGAFVAFNKAKLCGVPGKMCYEHGKMFIVDGTTALISSGNFNRANLCNLKYNPSVCNRDYSYLTRDADVIQTLSAVFANDLKGAAYDIASVIAPTKAKLTVSPLSLEPLVAFIKSAKTSIVIENQYLKEPQINRALEERARAGVQVYATVASVCSFCRPQGTVAANWTSIFKDFDQAGIHTRMFDGQIVVGGKPGYLHAKAIVIDHARAWMGSVNGSTTAVSRNREFGIFFDDPKNVAHLEQTMLKDQNNPDGESWSDSLKCTKDPTHDAPGSGCDSGSEN